jgi:hypothetical protein
MPRVLDLHVAPVFCVPFEFAMLNP